ncbi:MAG: DUF72 domain-containing protein [Gemmataceae bacterium]|nr:DUF72 domain-containing protein [Gemmataceae bacterium]
MNSLFDEFDEPPPQAARLAPALRSLAERGIYFGTSSWKYDGWLGSIYSPDRYLTRGKLSHKKFEAECLREYAATFPVVGGDFSFYQFPTAEFWTHLFGQVPPQFGFGLKVPEEITVLCWPGHARYGVRAGHTNQHFLNAALFEQAFTKLLEPYREHVSVMIFEFGSFSKHELATAEFFEHLDRFLEALPKGWSYAVEIRNQDFVDPKYFAILARHNVAHVFNAWTKMPTLADQMAIPEAFTADFTVVRALLQKGRTYEQAVKMFQPYREVVQPDPGTRAALKNLAEESLRMGRRAYAFLNNRLEGNSPGTIEAVVASIEESRKTP